VDVTNWLPAERPLVLRRLTTSWVNNYLWLRPVCKRQIPCGVSVCDGSRSPFSTSYPTKKVDGLLVASSARRLLGDVTKRPSGSMWATGVSAISVPADGGLITGRQDCGGAMPAPTFRCGAAPSP
jgi:hypothetical protein